MKRFWGMATLVVLGSVAASGAEEPASRAITPDTITRKASPTGAQAAYVVGSASSTGLYVISAFYPAGTRGTPHTHPDDRVTTVISGTLYAGTGPVFDPAKAQALPPGSVLLTPGGTLHWAWAKDGDVLVQEVGVGPTANKFPASTGQK